MNPIHWNPNPILLDLGPLQIRWYGLCFFTAFFLGYLMVRKAMFQRGLQQKEVDSLLSHMMIGTIIGSRLVHCFFYEPNYYLEHPIEILKIWNGGLASHGGALGILIGIWLYCKKNQQQYLETLDLIAIPSALGGACIRIGNFINSEILGTPSDLPWAIVFVQHQNDAFLGIARHPAMLYEALAYIIIFTSLFLLSKLNFLNQNGFKTGLFLVLVFSSRIAIEPYKLIQASYEREGNFHVGSWLSLPFIGFGLFLIYKSLKKSSNV